MRAICYLINLSLMLSCLYGGRSVAQDSLLSKSDMVALDFSILAAKKKLVVAKDLSVMPAYDQLLSDADKLLSFKAVSVMDKTGVPPSGTRHDYMSIAPY